MGASNGSRAPQGMLARALAILECFSADEPALTAAELAERAGLPPSTTHRLLATLLDEGLLVRAPGARYAVGPRVWERGTLSPLALHLHDRAIPHMLRLYEATGENVHLAVLDDDDPSLAEALYVARLTGRTSIATLTTAGGRLPLHATGVGKALLADRADEWLDAFLERPLSAETTKTITDPEVLRVDLARARARGYAVTSEEMTLDNISVAVSLGSVPGLPPSAIGIVAHIDRFEERRLAPIVVQTARDLTATLREATPTH